MKKLFTVAAALLVVASVSAQRGPSAYGDATVSKRGIALLPTCGDLGLSVSADPFLDYFGNMFNGTSDNYAPKLQSFGISGKYFLQPDRAIRAGINLEYDKYTNVVEVAHSSIADKMVENKTKDNDFGIMLFGGYEWRRGHGRVQGFYGAQGLIGYASSKTKYEYGEKLSADNAASRPLEEKSAGRFAFGAGGFVGVEYFFAPKLSIGGELGLNIMFSVEGKSKTESEAFVDGKVVKTSVDTVDKDNYFGIDTKDYGRLSLNFYF